MYNEIQNVFSSIKGKGILNELNIPLSSYVKYEQRNMNLSNPKIIQQIIDILHIENIEKFPEYFKFLKTNPNQKMRDYMAKNNMNINKFAKFININHKVVHQWIKRNTTISKQNYEKLKKNYKSIKKKKI